MYYALFPPWTCPSTWDDGAEPDQNLHLWSTETAPSAAEGGIYQALDQQNQIHSFPCAATPLSQHKVLRILICPAFLHHSRVHIHATIHPVLIYPKITYREVLVVPTAVSHRRQPQWKIYVKLSARQPLMYPMRSPAPLPAPPVLFTASQWSLAAGFITERWAMLRGWTTWSIFREEWNCYSTRLSQSQVLAILHGGWESLGAWLIFSTYIHSKYPWCNPVQDRGCFQAVVQWGKSISLTHCHVLGLWSAWPSPLCLWPPPKL